MEGKRLTNATVSLVMNTCQTLNFAASVQQLLPEGVMVRMHLEREGLEFGDLGGAVVFRQDEIDLRSAKSAAIPVDVFAGEHEYWGAVPVLAILGLEWFDDALVTVLSCIDLMRWLKQRPE